MSKKPLCLIIRDGWGKGNDEKINAIYSANTPHTDYYEKNYPYTEISTSGEEVGLPAGYQGNSEVGHLNIGAGRVVYQSLSRIDRAVKDGSFMDNEAFNNAINHVKENNGTLHLVGLIQEEGVHAVTRHAHAILELCKKQNLSNVLIHGISDGRDTPPKSAHEHFTFLQEGIDRIGVGRVASVIGRYYAMDRDTRWERTKTAYDALMSGEGEKVSSWKEALDNAYQADETDEFVKPRTIDFNGVDSNDAIIFFNFRFDRTRQITKAIVEKSFDEFPTVDKSVHFVAMTHYYDNGNFKEAFPELKNEKILGEVLAENGLSQLRCAETEKYAHVTFFFNSLSDVPFEKEERILVKSPNVATYDLQPEMSIFEVRDRLLEAIESDKYDVIITNFANCDMVGHTGVYDAILKAVEAVDTCVHDVVEAVTAKGGACIVSADHGNADKTKLDDGSPMTSHTKNPVQLMVIGAGDVSLRSGGSLCDIAPTVLELIGVKQPEEMTGTSLIVK